MPSANVRQRRHSTEHPHREGGNGRPNACWLFWVVGIVDRLRRELSIGDVLIAVDGEDTSAQTHEAIVALLAEKRGVEKTLTVRRCLSSAHGAVGKELPSSAFASITAPPGKLGVVFETHADGHATVAELKPESSVAAAGFAVGDVVIAVDGDDTSKHPPAALVRLLSEKEGQVKTLTVRHTTPTPTRAKQIVV